MRKSRLTEKQIVRILKEVEGGRQVKEVCRPYGVSDARTTTGKPNMAAWRHRTSCASKRWSMRTGV